MSLGVERALGHDVRLAVTGVWRENKNFIGSVLPLARWTKTTLNTTATPGFPSEPITVYKWANRSASQGTLLVTNPDGFQYLDPSGNVLGTVDAHRSYKAAMFVLSKAYSHRWRGQVSYVYSKVKGTVDNSSEGTFGPSRFYETPTRSLVNSDGPLTNDRPNELKALLGVQVPVLEIAVNAYYRSISGRTYTPFQRFSSSQTSFSSYFGSSSGRQPLLEPRGSRRLPTENILDVRLEKIFTFGARKDRLAVYADITNVFNKALITSVLTRVPSTKIAGVSTPVLFEAPGAITAPRQTVLGARWSF